MLLRVKVTANSRRPGIVGLAGSVLHVKVAAPPVDGLANAEVCAAVAELLKLPSSQVEIKTGHSAKLKTLLVSGVDEQQLFAILRQCSLVNSQGYLDI